MSGRSYRAVSVFCGPSCECRSFGSYLSTILSEESCRGYGEEGKVKGDGARIIGQGGRSLTGLGIGRRLCAILGVEPRGLGRYRPQVDKINARPPLGTGIATPIRS